ncbi:hypothetical protein SAMN04487891_11071 [Flagellimonas taeanensis]|uniref:Uncharacterized protein n=1 Tax=Flagellimonas taeanensis TaxID=1005926 RepID=A0A1I1IWM2_9FLAO|nr:hypothetical protein SAMN04487891_11071 [Allomuricauda taeanensis]
MFYVYRPGSLTSLIKKIQCVSKYAVSSVSPIVGSPNHHSM